MTIQYIIVGLIIASASGAMLFRLFRSVKQPAGKCSGCAVSGCKSRVSVPGAAASCPPGPKTTSPAKASGIR